jgi:hypothetical protein
MPTVVFFPIISFLIARLRWTVTYHLQNRTQELQACCSCLFRSKKELDEADKEKSDRSERQNATN